MKKKLFSILFVAEMFFSLTAFTSTDTKAVSVSVFYGIAAVFAICIFLVYLFGVRKKSPWFILLFSSVIIVNSGYLVLSVSRTLDEALLSNRISYLGSVFLPMSMLMIILDAAGIKYSKLLTGFLTGAGIIVFLIAASPGYLDIYYKEVSIVFVNGAAMLNKVYGPLHIIYLFYLMIYFSSMIIFIVAGIVKKKIYCIAQTAFLLCSVFINIGVWLLEQFVRIDFEILSVSYVITELFLLFLCFLLQENEKHKKAEFSDSGKSISDSICEETAQIIQECDNAFDEEKNVSFYETEEFRCFMLGLGTLTNTERRIYDYYIEGKSTKEVLTLLGITENTLKYHNKNIYGKLGVNSRKQLREIAFKLSGVNNEQ